MYCILTIRSLVTFTRTGMPAVHRVRHILLKESWILQKGRPTNPNVVQFSDNVFDNENFHVRFTTTLTWELRHSEGNPKWVKIGQRDQFDRFQPSQTNFTRVCTCHINQPSERELRHSEGNPKWVKIGQPDQFDRFQPSQTDFTRVCTCHINQPSERPAARA